MAEERETEHLLDLPVQDEQTRKNILAGTPISDATATGKERARLHENADDDIPQGEDRGSRVPIAGGDSIRPDAEGPSEGAGGQIQPAIFSPNGTVPLGMVGSPSGPVPVGALGLDPHESNKRLREAVGASGRPAVHQGFERVPRATIENASAASLRSAAEDRGYDLGPEAGARVTRARFIDAQNKAFGNEEEGTSSSGSLGGEDTSGQPAAPTA